MKVVGAYHPGPNPRPDRVTIGRSKLGWWCCHVGRWDTSFGIYSDGYFYTNGTWHKTAIEITPRATVIEVKYEINNYPTGYFRSLQHIKEVLTTLYGEDSLSQITFEYQEGCMEGS